MNSSHDGGHPNPASPGAQDNVRLLFPHQPVANPQALQGRRDLPAPGRHRNHPEWLARVKIPNFPGSGIVLRRNHGNFPPQLLQIERKLMRMISNPTRPGRKLTGYH